MAAALRYFGNLNNEILSCFGSLSSSEAKGPAFLVQKLKEVEMPGFTLGMKHILKNFCINNPEYSMGEKLYMIFRD